MVELSIVILIITILIAGVTQGSRLVKKSRLSEAQTLTTQSSVNDYPDLVLWYETSLQSSIADQESNDGNNVSTWYDNSPQAITKNHATQSNIANQPKFYSDIFNGAIPALRFDGSQFLNFDGSILANNSYTVFVVEQRRSANSTISPFIGGSDTSTTNGNLTLGYRNNTTMTQAQSSNDMDFATPAYTSPITKIHSFYLNTTDGKKYWLNGGDNPDAVNAGQTASLVSYNGAAVGRYSANYFNGDLGEIIIFKRALRSEERKTIEDYLSKKYNIKIN